MDAIRRIYLYVVSYISLIAFTGALLALLTTLLDADAIDVAGAIATTLAIILIALPLYLAHWLIAERAASRSEGERASFERQIYLYLTQITYLLGVLGIAFVYLDLLFSTILGNPSVPRSETGSFVRDSLIVILVLGLFLFYHRRVSLADERTSAPIDNLATVRRFFFLLVSAGALLALAIAIIEILRLILVQLTNVDAIVGAGFANSLAALVTVLPLWVISWQTLQQRFKADAPGERESALRKLYLYGVIFVAVMTTVLNAAGVLQAMLRTLLNLPNEGDIRDVIATVLVVGAVWVYHAIVLRQDERLTDTPIKDGADADSATPAPASNRPRQAAIRRAYLYLVAAVGLAALLSGLAGTIDNLLNLLLEDGGVSAREGLATWSAAILVGLPVWLLPWVQAQRAAADPAQPDERRSLIRRIYLYFFLLVATLTVLGSAIYLLTQLLNVILGASGESGSFFRNVSQAVAYLLIGVGVWAYHGTLLRQDGQLVQKDQAAAMPNARVAVINSDPAATDALLTHLKRELPSLTPDVLSWPLPADSDPTVLANAAVIVSPAAALTLPDFNTMLSASPARKLFIPLASPQWAWAGVANESDASLLREAATATRQILRGETITANRTFSPLNIAGAVVVVLLLCGVFCFGLQFLINGFGF